MSSTYLDVLKMLTHQQTQELLKETFGEKNARYHTLDEISLNRLIAKLSEHQQLQIKVLDIHRKAMIDFSKPENVRKRQAERNRQLQELARDGNKMFTI
jgi:hypothetical protein